MCTWLYFFFFNDTATTEIYTLSLHDALPIFPGRGQLSRSSRGRRGCGHGHGIPELCADRKSTRLNSSHSQISYAVFCLKKKKNITPVRPIYCLNIHLDVSHDARQDLQVLHSI